MKLRRLLLFLTCLTGVKCGKYVLPNVKIEALESGGLKASIPVHPREKLELFTFDANVNKNIRSWEEGTISGSTTTPDEGRWTIIDRNVKLNIGDKIHYWVFAQTGRRGYEKENLEFEVKEFVRTTDHCEKSISTFDQDESLCKDEIIFEDDFTSNVLNKNIWKIHNYIPTYLQDYGDNEFVSYEDSEDNLLIQNGFLTIRPKERPARIEELDLSSKCTFSQPNEGLRNFACKLVRNQPGRRPQAIIPPVISSRISSKKSFKYGKIEIKAKLSKGDWIVPQAVLLPSDYKYGPGYKSGALYAVYSRGNENITVGWGGVSYGPVLDKDKAKNLKTFAVDEGFHTYKMEWTPNGFIQWIDNEVVHTENITMIGYRGKIYFSDSLGTWTNSPSSSAPFDQNLHLTVTVGGYRDFQDVIGKPWTDGGIKSVVDFERDRQNWLKTWAGQTDFVIDYVKVSAL